MNRLHIAEEQVNTIWKDIELSFREAGKVSPAPGFVGRFRQRLAARQAAEARRQALLVASLWLGLAAIVALVLLWLLAPLFGNPTRLFFEIIELGLSFFSGLRTMLAFVAAALSFLPSFIPGDALYGLLAMLAAVLAWTFANLREFALVRGVRL